MDDTSRHDQTASQTDHDPSYGRLILLACLIGLIGGLVAAAYYHTLQVALSLVWKRVAPALWNLLPAALSGEIWIVTGVGGLLVGLCVKLLGTPGEISAVVNNLHMSHGRLDASQNPSMIATSLASISFGGSAGPEAPLVQIIGSCGSWIADRLGMVGRHARMLTFSGMAAALGAFFGAPLGGALFALEIPHRRGLEYYEAIVPSVTAAAMSFFVFSSLTELHAPIYAFAVESRVSTVTIVQAGILGIVGAGVGAAFITIFRMVHDASQSLSRFPISRAVLGGVAIGLLAQSMPADFPVTTLFWGEYQVVELIAAGTTLVSTYGTAWSIALLCMLAALKMLAIAFTLSAGFRGGFIFPLFFLGAAVGLAASVCSNGLLPVPLAMLCTMAAVNVAVTKTPLATPVILTTLSGAPLLPALAVASLVSFFISTRVNLIATQRSRRTA